MLPPPPMALFSLILVKFLNDDEQEAENLLPHFDTNFASRPILKAPLDIEKHKQTNCLTNWPTWLVIAQRLMEFSKRA